ncbi:MAG: LacI family DNA-binding transcriptional regulator [Clostridia bacterium]
MNNQIVTIKDIAAALGVSLTTVHKAIYDKKGISRATRQRVLDYIEKNDFRLNRAASALKRRPIQLVFAGVEPREFSRYFYQYINRGVDECAEELRAFNVQLTKYFTPELQREEQSNLLRNIFAERGENIDGLLLTSVSEHGLTEEIKMFTDQGIKVVTANSDAYNSTRHAFIGDNADGAGRVAAELMCSLYMPPTGQVLLLGGNRELANHRLNAHGFLDEIHRRAQQIDILEVYEFFDLDRLAERIERYLIAFDDIFGIYCNNARGTLIACKTVQQMGLSGRIKVIGADVYEELLPYFDSNTLTATLYQNPREQGYLGLKYLYNLVTDEGKVPEITELNVGIALHNNIRGFL